MADRIVITKGDLAEDDTLDALEDSLRALNPGASVVRAEFGAIHPDALFDTGLYDPSTKSLDVQRWLRDEAYADDDHHHHHDVNRHDDSIRAYCLRYDEPLPWEPFVGWIRTLIATHGEKLLRIKGIVNVAGQDKPIAIHGVQHLFHDPARLPDWPDGDTRSRIVFITRDLPRETVERLLEDMQGGDGEGELGHRAMRKPGSMRALEELGRVRLSPSFFMRDFLYSEIAAFYGLANVPDDPELAIAAGARLCETLLEPLRETFGTVSVRSGYRSEEVNGFGNRNGLNCASNEASRAGHIWDRRDAEGRHGRHGICIVIPWFADRYAETGDWRPLAMVRSTTACPIPASASFRSSPPSTQWLANIPDDRRSWLRRAEGRRRHARLSRSRDSYAGFPRETFGAGSPVGELRVPARKRSRTGPSIRDYKAMRTGSGLRIPTRRVVPVAVPSVDRRFRRGLSWAPRPASVHPLVSPHRYAETGALASR